MPGKNFGPLAVIFIVTAAVLLIPVLMQTGVASAQCSWQNCLSIVRMFDSPGDYNWMGSWDPRFDYDMQKHYCGVNLNDCNTRCDLQYSCQTCRLR
ncbi:exported hypothetical protein [Syntrophobacter sp. SbD1]|nr:exported hypothetical protein [Syntrophobacter sp. SbD1]